MILDYVLLAYSFVGILVAGGLIFSRRTANQYLALFVLSFAIDQLYFSYEAGGLIWSYPNFYMLTFSTTLLLGPALYFHIKQVNGASHSDPKRFLLHSVPFILLSGFTIYLLSIEGLDRVKYVGSHYYEVIQPINYFKVVHVCVYAILILVYISRNVSSREKKRYSVTLGVMYFITAVLQACLTAAILLSKYFIVYYLIVSTMVLLIGYVLYFRPEYLEKIHTKYAGSILQSGDMTRIKRKIEDYLSIRERVIDPNLNLTMLASSIDEHKHHVSQTLSEELDMSFNDVINSKRVEISKELLLNSENDHLTIFGIAQESGFASKNTYNRAFRKFNGCTPGEYKKRYRST